MDIDSGVNKKLTDKLQDYLSCDTIKARGGEIKVETKEGEYAMFIIEFPSY
jgi:hypothetical protein